MSGYDVDGAVQKFCELYGAFDTSLYKFVSGYVFTMSLEILAMYEGCFWELCSN